MKYNPFKMFGSYVGAILYPIITIYSLNNVSTISQYLLLPLYPFSYISKLIPSTCSGFSCLGVILWPMIIGSILVGFLIGWGIHSLIRKIKK